MTVRRERPVAERPVVERDEAVPVAPGRVAAAVITSYSIHYTKLYDRARWHDGLLYVVNRFGQDNVQVLNPAQGFATVQQFSTGAGSNPHDIAFASPVKAYVTRYELADLLISYNFV